MYMHNPPHPGEVLKELYIDPLNLTVTEAAKGLCVTRKALSELINGKFQPVQGSEKEIPADLVFLALGFTGPEKNELLDQLEVTLDDKGNIIRDHEYSTASEGVFVCGDAGRGQSLIVWAIAEGRSAASAIDKYLTGNTQLPYPIEPTARPMMV